MPRTRAEQSLPHALSPAPAAPCSRAPRADRVARPPPRTAGAQGTDPRPKTRRPGRGGEVSGSAGQAWRAVAAAGCRFLALEVLSPFLSPGCVGPPSFPGWQCRRNDRSRLRTLPAPAPRGFVCFFTGPLGPAQLRFHRGEAKSPRKGSDGRAAWDSGSGRRALGPGCKRRPGRCALCLGSSNPGGWR